MLPPINLERLFSGKTRLIHVSDIDEEAFIVWGMAPIEVCAICNKNPETCPHNSQPTTSSLKSPNLPKADGKKEEKE